MRKLALQTQQRTQFVRLDAEIQRIVTESAISEGVCHVFVPHTTAGITINENADPDVIRDITHTLEHLVPWNRPYTHSEGNAAAHVKASAMGSHQTIFIRGGKLALGTWQSLFFCEFDGPRNREVWVQTLSASET